MLFPELTRRNLISLNDGKINKALVYSILNEHAAKHLENTIVECFHVRDHRTGMGEREVGRLCFNWMADVHPHIFIHAMKHIPTFGRWDDLLYIKNGYMRSYIYDYIAVQFQIDLLNMKIGKEVSLLAKWLPTEGKSWARQHRIEFNQLLSRLKMEPKEYRQTVSVLRKRIDLPEHHATGLGKKKKKHHSKMKKNVKPPFEGEGVGETKEDLRYKSIVSDLKINITI
jgi:hypothetical protein